MGKLLITFILFAGWLTIYALGMLILTWGAIQAEQYIFATLCGLNSIFGFSLLFGAKWAWSLLLRFLEHEHEIILHESFTSTTEKTK